MLITLWNLISYSPTSATQINYDFLNENEIRKNIENITQENINSIEKEQIIEKFKLALYAISEIKHSKIKIKEYQNIIDNFPSIIHQLHHKKQTKNKTNYLQNENSEKNNNHKNNITISSNELRKYQIEINQQLTTLDQELQEEQNLAQSINNSLILLPQQHTEAKKEINKINKKISYLNTIKKTSRLEHATLIALQAEKEAKQLKITELELAQLSANNRQEISRLHIESLKDRYDQLDKEFYTTHIQLNNIQEKETIQTIKTMETLSNITKNNTIFPKNIIQQLQINQKLSKSLRKQIQNINYITLQQREITTCSLKHRQALTKLLEQSQWITKSTALGETLRTQISKLPKPNTYKMKQIDIEMNEIRKNRLHYEEQINNLPFILKHNNKEHETLNNNQKNILNTQINIQRTLLNSLLTNYDIQILELTKLKISYEQLQDIIKEINKIIHHHLFLVADIYPITLSYLSKIYQNLYLLINKQTLYQLKDTGKIIFFKNIKISILFFILLLFICWTYTTYHHYYYIFLKQSKKQLNTTSKKIFSLTLQNIFWSNIITLPILILWLIIGYILSQTWECPTSAIIGQKIILFTPILWLTTIIQYFLSKDGLFILYFKWNKQNINNIKNHYTFRIIMIISLFIILIIFNDYNNKEFYSTLGRLFFITLCLLLTYTTYIFKKENFPLYINQHGSSNNTTNHILWNFMIISPIISATTSYFGYLALSQTLLINVETTLAIWIISSIVYHTVQCLIITQKKQILYIYQNNQKEKTKKQKHNKNKNNKQLLLPTFLHHINNLTNTYTINNNVVKKNITNTNNILNIITNKSLQFIKLIIILTTCIITFFLWSEFHFIFIFLKKFTLWNITVTIQGENHIRSITLETLLTSSLILFITIKTVKFLPSLLEIIILQHFNVTQGTNYAIITLTKYTIMILGIITGCIYIGLEWSKLQWLIAAIGVGLGFGLQEIFANFISGLIILFEKPIRIGDTITICNLTGNITEINTRATTIIDRNHKEIIIPNKEFITKKFVNWSLSDTITRIVLKVPGPSQTNTETIIRILLKAVQNCPLVLHTPKPEIYLIDIQQGIPLFEIRMHTEKINHRMLLRHQVHILIIQFYKKHGLQLPFPHINVHHSNQINNKKNKHNQNLKNRL